MTEQHRERLEAILRELWAAKSLDLHMCDGTTKQDKFGLLRDLREDVRAVLSALAPQAGDNAEEPVERKFKRGDRVRKTRGSSWHGVVVGFYSTDLTPIGYCVESEREPGSVQIYPESALEPAPDQEEPILHVSQEILVPAALASHPYTSTPVVSQNAPALEDKGGDGDWILIAKIAGKHGIRFPTNAAMQAFLREIRGPHE